MPVYSSKAVLELREMSVAMSNVKSTDASALEQNNRMVLGFPSSWYSLNASCTLTAITLEAVEKFVGI